MLSPKSKEIELKISIANNWPLIFVSSCDNIIKIGSNIAHFSSSFEFWIINIKAFDAAFNKLSSFFVVIISFIKGTILSITILYPSSLFNKKFRNFSNPSKKDNIKIGFIFFLKDNSFTKGNKHPIVFSNPISSEYEYKFFKKVQLKSISL